MASTSRTGAFDEWGGSEVFQTGAWRHKILSSAAITFRSVLQEGEAHPHGFVVGRAFWNVTGLRVSGKDQRRSFADGTFGDVFFNVFRINGHGRWNRFRSGQPVRFSVSASVSASVISVTEGRWTGVESFDTRTRFTKILSMVVIVANGV